MFDDEGGVSHEENPTRQPAHGDQEQPHIIVPKGKVTADFGRSNGSDVELSPTNPSLSSSPFAREPNQTVTLERQTDEHSGAMDQGFDDSGRSSDEIVQLPSVSDSAGLVGSPVIGFYQDEIRDPQSVALKASDASLSSTGSTETVIKHKKRSSYSIFPPVRRPTSSSSARSISAPLRPTGKESRDGLSPLASSFSPSEARRISSLPSHASLQAAVDSGANIQYPVIRAPSYARSWAESSIGVPKRSDDRKASDKWNPHLSTVHSEAHQSSSSRNSALPSETSSMAVHRSSDLSNLPEMPQPAFVRQRDASGSTIRVVNGGEDDVSNLPSPFFHSRGSAFFSVLSRETNQELGRSPLETAPGSRGNLFTNSVPSWARQRNNKQEQKKSGSRGSEIADETQNARDSMLGAPGSSTEASESRPQSNPSAVSDNFSLRIFRTRNRPPDIITQRQHRDSMAITPITATDDNLVEIVGPLRRKVSDIWSPHLWHDKRTTLRRRSMFKPPSLDEQAEGNALNRRNTQIMLFAVGFLVPLGMCSNTLTA